MTPRPAEPSPEPPPVRALVGVSGWKRRTLAKFFGGEVEFIDDPREAASHAARAGGAVGVWATREPTDLAERCADRGVDLVRIEDGFLRSVGLGADLIPGASIVVDRAGIYFDPTRPSDLETILAQTEFDDALRARAAALRQSIVRTGLTKYNLSRGGSVERNDRARRWILVPGQVEDDLSVRLGGAGVAGNLDLLQRVRSANPDACILYKPHPDVEAGHRPGRIDPAAALRLADRYVANASAESLLGVVDEVHTLTSLMGFEALLRGLPVTVHGQPFFAGWGLTTDLAPQLPRRGRKLDLDELVAGALILYPLHLDPVDERRCGPEALVARLSERRYWKSGALVHARRLQGALVRALSGLGLELRRSR